MKIEKFIQKLIIVRTVFKYCYFISLFTVFAGIIMIFWCDWSIAWRTIVTGLICMFFFDFMISVIKESISKLRESENNLNNK